MKTKEIEAYLAFAKIVAGMSYAERLKVGAVIAKEDGDIVSYGYNGTPRGYDNVCETKDYVNKAIYCARSLDEVTNSYPFVDFGDDLGLNRYRMVTRPEVIHAELNAIMKAARSGKSCEGAWLFLTHMPCDGCVKHIVQSGIKTVVYSDIYASASHGNSNGDEMFEKAGINMFQWNGYVPFFGKSDGGIAQ